MNKIFIYLLCALTIIFPFTLSRSCKIKLEWDSRVKPSNNVFGIVWPFLYLLMTVSLYLILTSTKTCSLYYVALISTIFGLILNYLYIIKTGCHNDWVSGLYVLILYLMVLLIQLLSCYNVNKIAGLLLAPLVGWCIFALILNSLYVNRLK